ncbi:DegT/DnrJ/EryC1/StrS family aminotransferase, partial [Candidatus Pelagibacter sp.]|nr:DegT/DnrJ/EryC1/StrS family aminotransferase [Candidatus Pelagibacter sp.]
MKILPYSRQKIDKKDIDAVTKVLKSDFLTQGSNVEKFERKISKKVGSKYGIAVNSATSALHISCMSIGIKKKDIVWTSANSFVASINCAKYLDAEVDFIDIDKDTYNLSIKDLKQKLIVAKKNKKLPKLIIVVHFAGFPCELKEIFKLSKIYDFKIIEDASHAIGSKYLGSCIGNCQYSDVTVFSFHPVKIITSGEGGMCLTNNKKLKDRMLLLRSHGITKENNRFKKKFLNQPWYYEQQTLGYNYRMSDIHA